MMKHVKVQWTVYAIALLLVGLAVFGLVRLGFGAYGEIQPDGDSIVGLWHLEDLTDATSNGNDWTSNGTPTSTGNGYLGKGYEFGTNDFFIIETPTELQLTSDFTITMWYYPTSIPGWVQLFSVGVNPDRYAMWLNSTDNRLYAAINSDYTGLYKDVGLVTDAWSFLAIAFDDSADSVEFFRNGVSYGTQTTTQSPDTLGHNAYLCSESYDCTGTVDEVVVYDRPLSATEIKQIYSMQKGGYGVVD